MSTNQEIIDQALQEIGVIEAGESADATDSATALTTLNQMMAAWHQSDKDLSWFPQDTLADTIPIPDWAEKGIVSSLAIECAAPFRVPVTAELATKAIDGENTISRTLINQSLEPIDNGNLPYGTGQYYRGRRYNINTG